jgi:hypothetical protein
MIESAARRPANIRQGILERNLSRANIFRGGD